MEHKQWTRRQVLAVSGAVGLTALGVPIPLGAKANYEQVVLAKKPVAYWRLGEATGSDAVDRTANGHTGTYHGSPVFQARGAIKSDANTAITLDGHRSYIEIA